MFDCTCNTQNSLLLNQHNGDDAPQGTDHFSMFPIGVITRTQCLSHCWKHLRNSFSWLCLAQPEIQLESPQHPRMNTARYDWIFISWPGITLEWKCAPFLQALAPGKSLLFLVVIQQTEHKFCGSPFGSLFHRIFLLCPLLSLSTPSKYNDLWNCSAQILRRIGRIKHTHTRVCLWGWGGVGGWQFCCDHLRLCILTVHIGSFGIL